MLAKRFGQEKPLAYKLSHEGILCLIVIFLTFSLPFVKFVLLLTTKFARPSKILLPSLFCSAAAPGGNHMEQRNLTLLTDLYELTMMQGYFKEKDANETVVFDMFYRNKSPTATVLPICAGLEQVIEVY